MRLRKPIPARIRTQDGGAKHGALQQRLLLRSMLRDQMRRPSQIIPDPNHRHQLLPAKPLRRLVQPSGEALRPRDADVPQIGSVQGRDRPRQLPPDPLREERRREVQNQRKPQFQFGVSVQRRRRRRR
ncbi:hypothetical protein LINPERHAP1_LOCUS32423 [Linum perenne]